MGVVKTVLGVEEYCLYTSVAFVRLLGQDGVLYLSCHYPYHYLILLLLFCLGGPPPPQKQWGAGLLYWKRLQAKLLRPADMRYRVSALKEM